MHKLPDAWVGIPAERGSYSRGVIHTDPVSGLSIHGEDFNGVYCCGEVDGDLYVVCHEPEGGAGFELHVLRKNYPRDPEAVEKCETMGELYAWIVENGGAPLPREVLLEGCGETWVAENLPPQPSYAVHSYAVFRIKTIGDAPRPGETIQKFAERVSDAVAASLNHIDVRGVAPEGCDVEQIEYAEDIAYVLVDEIVPDNSNPSGQQTIMHWFDDRMEPNNGNGTDPARYVRAEKEKERLLRIATNRSDRLLALHGLVYDIAQTPLQGEPCADAPDGRQAWLDREHVLERLTEIVRQCREALKRDDAIHHKLTETT